MINRQEIIQRLENLKSSHKDFYIRRPELLEQLNSKIDALKSGVDYKIRNANWVIAYTWGNSAELQTLDSTRETTLGQVKNKIMTVDMAKECCQTMYDNYTPMIPTDYLTEEEKKHIEDLNKIIGERIQDLNYGKR